ncbi:lactadherin-like [Amphiura filiformis]|uniref:lactadherin-like n=1 Tax=Amphiura filiformis TaxID=82378 RepID=UPI003B22562E
MQVDFNAWTEGEPNNVDDEDCVGMYGNITQQDSRGLWNDFRCNASMTYICRVFKECMRPLGMENYEIADNKISASSFDGDDRVPQYGRLNNELPWTSNSNDNTPWIQVDLGQQVIATGVFTQGHQSESGHKYCVEEFKVKTGLTEASLFYLHDNDGTTEKAFIANCADTPNVAVMSEFHSRPRAQFVRIEPTKCYRNGVSQINVGQSHVVIRSESDRASNIDDEER